MNRTLFCRVKEALKRVAKLEKNQNRVGGKCCLDVEERSAVPPLDQEYIQILITEVIYENKTITQ